MKSIINLKVKDYVRNWSDQQISTEYKGVSVNIDIKGTECIMIFEGDDDHEYIFRLIWELLFLYDGYFYKLYLYEVNGCKQDLKRLITLPFYYTDKNWYVSELLGRAERNLSPEVLKNYDTFRNTGISDKKMTKSVVNAFYYLSSKDYGKINVNHRLSLLLNIADGFIINTYKDTGSIKGNYDKLFKKTVNKEILQKGISLLGIDGEKYKFLLAGERNTFDHYVYLEDNLTALIFDPNDSMSDYIIWYFVYVMDLVIRINFLKVVGVTLDQDAVDYALSAINDWILKMILMKSVLHIIIRFAKH